MNKGTLLHLVEYLEQGGIERLLEQLTYHQSKMRRVMIYAYETPVAIGIAKEISARGIPVVLDKKKSGFDISLLFRLVKLVNKEKISVIHTHDFGPILYAVLLKIFNPKLKLVHTQHTLQNLIHNRKYSLAIQVARVFYSSFVVVSNHVKNTIEKTSPLLKGFTKTIPNGVDTSHFNYISNQRPHSILQLVSVSRISPEKNLPFLISVCAWLKKQGIEFKYTHVGDGDRNILAYLDSMVTTFDLKNEVHYLGFQSDIRPFLENADMFLSGSSTEGLPISVLEAMSAGLPCVLSDIDPHKIFNHPLVRISSVNVPAFGTAILDLWEHKNDWRICSRELQNFVQNGYSLSQMVNKYESCYV